MWVAAALLVLAGCSEDPEPVIEPPAETTPASDPSPTATPEAKEPWEKKTKAGAVAFAEHWVEVLNAAGESGDTSSLRAASAKGCQSCQRLIDYIDDVYAAGGRIEGSDWRVLEVSEARRTREGYTALTARVRQQEARVYRTGEPVERVSSDSFAVAFEFAWSRSRWSAARADLLA